jgi:adenylate cyclase
MTTQVDKTRPREVKRKLTAILSADVKGYSRLMGEDEAGTIRTLNAYKEVIADLVQQHHGRVVDAPGDNVLAEFSSVVDAVECAVEIQKELKIRNADRPQNQKMEFRIGINLGDVVEEEEKIFGDGVNIASRLESLSEAGGICISGTAFDHIRNKLKLGYEYLGEQPVKNIALPVRVYKVLTEPEEAGKVIGEKRVKPRHWQSAAIGLVVILLVVVAAVVAWRLYFTPTASDEVASKEKMAFPLPDVPSIAVLPFVNMSEDQKQEFLSDGITENIITALSKVPRLFVISRQSTFFYKGKPVKVKQVAEDLGVQYVLEGSLQRSPDRIRISAQLIDALTGRHIWAEKYDRDLKDIFALQDEITMKVLAAVRVKLTEGGVSSAASKYYKGKRGFDCYLKLMEAAKHIDRFTIEDINVARRLNEEAISMCPENPVGYALLGQVYMQDAILGNTKSPRETLAKGESLVKKALSIDDSLPIAHFLLTGFYLARREHDKAIAEGERAVALDPGGSYAYFQYGSALLFACRPQEALPILQKAVRLNPNAEAYNLLFFANALSTTGRLEEAVSVYKKALQRAPDYIPAHLGLAGAYVRMGREKEARAEAEEVLRINPKFSLDYFAKTVLVYKDQSVTDRIVDTWRKAGLPDKPLTSIPPSDEDAPKEKVPPPSREKVSKPVTPPALKVEVASKEKMAYPLPDVPSIAVLPFVNMSGDPKQEFFSDGITENIITALSKVPSLFVISRQSTFFYRGKPVKVKQIAEELGVQYVLEGSVQRSGDRIRINAQLIDALTGRHIWSEKYDRDLKDIFALQDEVTLKILKAMQVKMRGGEEAALIQQWKCSENLECWLKWLEVAKYQEQLTIESNNMARRKAEEILALCPGHT